jgi:hypothetical protein
VKREVGRQILILEAKMNQRCFFLAPIMASFAIVASGQITVVATNLNNPRGLAFGPNQNLYVTEAGTGGGTGSGAVDVIEGPGTATPTFHPHFTQLASSNDSTGVVGPSGISVAPSGAVFLTFGSSAQAMSTSVKAGVTNQFGHVAQIATNGAFILGTDVGDFDNTWGPASPAGILALSGARYVVDPGSNTVDEVTSAGVRVVAFIPTTFAGPASPICVDQGSDGYLYIGTQAMGAYVASGYTPRSKIYRVPTYYSNASLSDADVWASQFYPISGCGFGKNNTDFYVTELVTSALNGPGAVIQVAVNADGSAGTRTKLGGKLLSYPSSFAVSGDNHIYVINNSTSSGTADTPGGPVGQVVRVAKP